MYSRERVGPRMEPWGTPTLLTGVLIAKLFALYANA